MNFHLVEDYLRANVTIEEEIDYKFIQVNQKGHKSDALTIHKTSKQTKGKTLTKIQTLKQTPQGTSTVWSIQVHLGLQGNIFFFRKLQPFNKYGRRKSISFGFLN